MEKCVMKLPLLLVSLFAACSHVYAQSHEISRVVSPDKKADVVVMEKSVGATVATPYEVFLVSTGKSPAQTDLILKVDKSPPPRAEWTDANTVVLKCNGGRVWHFQNFGSIATKNHDFLSVGVSLHCGENGYRDN